MSASKRMRKPSTDFVFLDNPGSYAIFIMNTFRKRNEMPKKLDKIKERALEEARKILLEEGYAALTVRRVSQMLRIGVGTIYNYFPSKDHLTAGVMLEDWQEALLAFEAEGIGEAEEVIRRLFALVRDFSERYQPVWVQYGGQEETDALRGRYHSVLVRQLAGYISPVLPDKAEDWLPSFLAELVLRFASDAQMQYEEIKAAVRKLLAQPGQVYTGT